MRNTHLFFPEYTQSWSSYYSGKSTSSKEENLFLHTPSQIPQTSIIHPHADMLCVISEYHMYQLFTQISFSHNIFYSILIPSSEICEIISLLKQFYIYFCPCGSGILTITLETLLFHMANSIYSQTINSMRAGCALFCFVCFTRIFRFQVNTGVMLAEQPSPAD